MSIFESILCFVAVAVVLWLLIISVEEFDQ